MPLSLVLTSTRVSSGENAPPVICMMSINWAMVYLLGCFGSSRGVLQAARKQIAKKSGKILFMAGWYCSFKDEIKFFAIPKTRCRRKSIFFGDDNFAAIAPYIVEITHPPMEVAHAIFEKSPNLRPEIAVPKESG